MYKAVIKTSRAVVSDKDKSLKAEFVEKVFEFNINDWCEVTLIVKTLRIFGYCIIYTETDLPPNH